MHHDDSGPDNNDENMSKDDMLKDGHLSIWDLLGFV